MMELRKNLILRSAQRARLEGRTAPIQWFANEPVGYNG